MCQSAWIPLGPIHHLDLTWSNGNRAASGSEPRVPEALISHNSPGALSEFGSPKPRVRGQSHPLPSALIAVASSN